MKLRIPWPRRIGVTPAFVVFLVALMGLPVASYVTLVQHSRQQALRQAEEFSRVVSIVRSFYASQVSARVLGHAGSVAVTERYREVDGAIPIPATLSIELGEAISRQAQSRDAAFSFAFLSDAPFRNRRRAAPDAFQVEALQRFRSDPSLQDHWRIEGDRLRLAIPVRMEASCVACHNHHPDSPARNWKVGDVRGLQEVSVAVSMAAQAGESVLLGVYLLFFAGSAGLALREYRTGNRSLLVLNERLEAGRQALERLAGDLRATSERQAALLDTATSGIVLVDRELRVRAANRRLHQMLGREDDTLPGADVRTWFVDEDGWRRAGDAFEALWRGLTQSGEWQFLRADGTRFVARLTGRAVDASDRDKGSVWVVDDITAEREAADQLRRAKELAEEGARAKSNFLANMSHEIRTPMNAVLGMTHLVLKTDLDDRQRDHLGKIQAAGRHLLGVINDILDYSRIEAGKMPVEHVDFDLRQTLDNALALVSQRAREKGLELVTHLPADVPRRLRGDARHLTQVLVNLLNNAVKFTEQGWVRVEVSVLPGVPADQRMLRVEVSDSGVGIAEEQQGRLFRSFEQADASTTRKYGGTGLGLAICRDLARLMGGEIGLRSRAGEGATFWFTARVQVPPPIPVATGEPALAPDRELEAGGPAAAGQPMPAVSSRDPAAVESASGDHRPEGSMAGDGPATFDDPSLRDRAHALARQMLLRLDAGDTEVLVLLRTHDALLQRWLGQRHASFARAVESFDFELGHRILEGALLADRSS